MKSSIILFFIAFSVISCKKNKVDQSALDETIIVNYAADKKLETTKTASGLHYIINEEGSGIKPTVNSTVTVVYKGYLTDGTVFDQSTEAGYTNSLSALIKGWQEGLPLFKVGSKGVLLIPSALGYGTQGSGSSIPKNAVIIFDIELIDVE
ncbi:MAG: FKBP-type peptidyl-prolyl cis-trans isomerase [Crocinitomicaceae bacterium]